MINRGPKEPMPFPGHRTQAQVMQMEREVNRQYELKGKPPRFYDPDPDTMRPRSVAADKRFLRAISKIGGSFSGSGERA